MSDKQEVQVISSGVDSLIARLRDEGVAEGKRKADKISQDAEKKAKATPASRPMPNCAPAVSEVTGWLRVNMITMP